jgi:hypothetical protein
MEINWLVHVRWKYGRKGFSNAARRCSRTSVPSFRLTNRAYWRVYGKLEWLILWWRKGKPMWSYCRKHDGGWSRDRRASIGNKRLERFDPLGRLQKSRRPPMPISRTTAMQNITENCVWCMYINNEIMSRVAACALWFQGKFTQNFVWTSRIFFVAAMRFSIRKLRSRIPVWRDILCMRCLSLHALKSLWTTHPSNSGISKFAWLRSWTSSLWTWYVIVDAILNLNHPECNQDFWSFMEYSCEAFANQGI